jgi:arylsulfatase A-like enzyme
MDVTPTMAARCAIGSFAEEFDGRDINSLFSGRASESRWNAERDALLYFNGVFLQCVRKANWKLHVSIYNTPLYVQAPAEGRFSMWLPDPQLYNLADDPGENYDVAKKYPDIVRDLLSRAEQMMENFPPDIREAFVAMKAKPFQPGAKYGPNPYKP